MFLPMCLTFDSILKCVLTVYVSLSRSIFIDYELPLVVWCMNHLLWYLNLHVLKNGSVYVSLTGIYNRHKILLFSFDSI